jgi:hypothetical protein
MVSWTGGAHPGVHTVQRGALAHRTNPAMCMREGSATQGPRRCAFGRVSSASGAGCTRLHRRAPSLGIPAGALMGGSQPGGSVDVMLHGMRR